ncbi:MAG: TIGR03088 family PEP-CTERM/XrtA system glycosyltransferase [Casimicrobiaceae bacterium]
MPDARPLVVHVMHAFDVGGLENGVVNLINRLPRDSYRHAVVALTHVTDFRDRVQRDDVTYVALDKRPGHALRLYPRLYRLFREWRPAIVHTRNLAALEVAVPAWAAGVPVRVHGEHGRDVSDLDGSNRKYQWVRRLYQPFVTHYVALSRDLERYLVDRVGIAQRRVSQIYNGVDGQHFRPARPRAAIAGCPFTGADVWLVGTVGRMQAVKDPLNLARAFIHALALDPTLRGRLRLVMVGDGPLRTEVVAALTAAGVQDLAWLPGERSDVPEILRGLDAFVLPSLAEGISNTILEAMASGLPVVATDVGGNGELVVAGSTGELVAAGDPVRLGEAIVAQACDPAAARRAGCAGRERVERLFALDAMVESYRRLYDALCAHRVPETTPGGASSSTLPLTDR